MNNSIPKLNFLGCGSAFNTELGATSAYLMINDTEMLLFDCGAGTLHRLKEEFGDKLKTLKHIHILLTHMHPDHVADLGNLCFYMYYSSEPYTARCTIHCPDPPFCGYLSTFLSIQGVAPSLICNTTIAKYVDPVVKDRVISGSEALDSLYTIDYMRHYAHSNKQLPSYYIYIHSKETHQYIIYAGDTSAFPPCHNEDDYCVLERVYIEMCSTSCGGIHYDVNVLARDIPSQIPRDKITGMHFDSEDTIKRAVEYGFDVPVLRKHVTLQLPIYYNPYKGEK